VAWGECHFIDNAGVEGNDEQASAVGIVFNLFDDVRKLVNCLAISCFPAAPLFAVYGAEIAVFVGPLIPDTYIVFF